MHDKYIGSGEGLALGRTAMDDRAPQTIRGKERELLGSVSSLAAEMPLAGMLDSAAADRNCGGIAADSYFEIVTATV
jgi:hypothetical protein